MSKSGLERYVCGDVDVCRCCRGQMGSRCGMGRAFIPTCALGTRGIVHVSCIMEAERSKLL